MSDMLFELRSMCRVLKNYCSVSADDDDDERLTLATGGTAESPLLCRSMLSTLSGSAVAFWSS